MIKILNIQGKTGYELMHGDYDVLAELKDNCTNGDMIKAMFPSVRIYQSGGYTSCLFQPSVMLEDTKSDWWNAPYERG